MKKQQATKKTAAPSPAATSSSSYNATTTRTSSSSAPGRPGDKFKELVVKTTSGKPQPKYKTSITVSTFNILFDLYNPEVLFSTERFTKQFEILEKLNLDILNLNEVTWDYYKLLQRQNIFSNYNCICGLDYESEREKQQGQLKSNSKSGGGGGGGKTKEEKMKQENGSMLLSKYKFEYAAFLRFSNFESRRPGIFVIVNVPDKKGIMIRLGVFCAHFKAMAGSEHVRLQQFKDVYRYVEEVTKKQPCDEVVVMGDFNLLPGEDDYLNLNFPKFQQRYVDLWPHIKPTEEGYTFDTLKNYFNVKLNPENKKRCRYDRIFMLDTKGSSMLSTSDSSISNYLIPKDAALYATEPMYPKQEGVSETSAATTTTVVDKSYLFPSDHFGLYVDLGVVDSKTAVRT